MKTAQKTNGSGNIFRDEESASKTKALEDIRPGDVVAITPAALRMARLSTMSPRLLYQIGWPNAFQVMHVFDTEEDGVCVTLDACCMNLVDRRTGKNRCTGHPVVFFEKLEPERPKGKAEKEQPERQRKPGDRGTSVSVPWIGELASIDFQEDEHNPTLTINIAGKRTMFTGSLAKIFAEAAKQSNIL